MIPSLSVGSIGISASYAAQGNYAASTATGTQTIDPIATSTVITMTPAIYGNPAQVSVTVSGSGGSTPVGNVSLTRGCQHSIDPGSR